LAPTQQELAVSSVLSTHHNWWPEKRKATFPKKQQVANFISLVFFCKAWHSSQRKLLIAACKSKEQETFHKLGSCQLDRTKTWSTPYTKMEEKIKCLSRSHWATVSLQILGWSSVIQEHFCAL